jgi:hypothetical protein
MSYPQSGASRRTYISAMGGLMAEFQLLGIAIHSRLVGSAWSFNAGVQNWNTCFGRLYANGITRRKDDGGRTIELISAEQPS